MSTDPRSMARLERDLGRLLITGVITSAVALAAGLALFLMAPGPLASDLLAAGLVVLMATPMLRVVLSVLEYIRMRDWLFVLITLVVVAELAVTVIYSLRRL